MRWRSERDLIWLWTTTCPPKRRRAGPVRPPDESFSAPRHSSWPGLLFMIWLIVRVTRLIAALVSSLVFVFLELPLLGVVKVFRAVIAPVAPSYLVVLI